MIANPRIGVLVLVLAGALLILFGCVEWNNKAKYQAPPDSVTWFTGCCLVCGSVLLGTGAVLDYFHQRTRQP